MPRLLYLKADAMLLAGPPVPQALPIAGVHQGPLFLSSPAFLQKPGHAVGQALPLIWLDQSRAIDGWYDLELRGKPCGQAKTGIEGEMR
jgi:hypothetical protein